MTLEGLNSAIIGVCEEIRKQEMKTRDWRSLEETELLKELVFCIVSSQMKYELALAVTERVIKVVVSKMVANTVIQSAPYSEIYEALLTPIAINQTNGSTTTQMPRFPKRISAFISEAVVTIYQKKQTIRSLLSSCSRPQQARQRLVQLVQGVGPKQASLFLRRVNYSNDLAVIDTHIMDYMARASGTAIRPSMISRIDHYEKVEESYIKKIEHFGFSTGCVDLAMWITMRVGKQEALI